LVCRCPIEAARNNETEIVRLLRDQGANPFLANGDGKTALDIATELGHAAAAEVLRNASTV
jgi:ankyrin repeat protein